MQWNRTAVTEKPKSCTKLNEMGQQLQNSPLVEKKCSRSGQQPLHSPLVEKTALEQDNSHRNLHLAKFILHLHLHFTLQTVDKPNLLWNNKNKCPQACLEMY